MIRKHLKDIPGIPIDKEGFANMTAHFALSKDDNVPNYAMRIMEFGPGGHTSMHTHREEHEFYFPDDNAEYVGADGLAVKMDRGDCLYVAPLEPHQIRNSGKGTMRIVCTVPILEGRDGKMTGM